MKQDNSDVITKEGLEELKAELKNRKEILRVEIAKKLKQASEQGDLSENAAYKSAMEDKEFNEARIEELENKIANAVVLKGKKNDTRVGLGETVIVKRMSDGEKKKYTLVGESEADPTEYKISVESPIGRALFGRHKGDTVKVEMPNGEEEFEILDIA